MAFFVYMLKCRDDSYYVGHTDNIEKRISEHKNKKYEGYTSARLPVKLVFVQSFTSRYEALSAEKKIKSWSKKKKEALITKNWNEISRLSRKKFL